MFEPVTVVKVRQATTVKVPAGGWILIGNPEQPLHEQIARRNDLLKAGNVSDEFERLHIGRIQDTHAPTRFVTTKENAAAAETQKERDKALAKGTKDALARQKEMQAKADAEAAKQHADKVKAINKENDSIRNRLASETAPPTDIKIELAPEQAEQPVEVKTEEKI